MTSTRESYKIKIDLSESPNTPRTNPLKMTKNPKGPGHCFQFDMFQKQTNLGCLEIDQWWMDKKGLYGERNQNSSNRCAAIDLFWSLCICEGSAFSERDIQETYILARLLPHARSNASRRVFIDASLENRDPKLRTAHDLTELDQFLSLSQDGRKNALDFNRATGNILGPPEYEQNVIDQYNEFVEELMDDTCEALSDGDFRKYQKAEAFWTEKMKSIGRRSGNLVKKNVLDILSYEARVAFHRCYSQAWSYILEAIAQKENLSDDSYLFHRLWHFDLITPSNESRDADFHLFHGHIFGLHPAGSEFIRTPTGQNLIGELIANPTGEEYHQRFLNGMNIACFKYADRYEVSKALRKKRTQNLTEGQAKIINSSGYVEPQNNHLKYLDES